MPEKVIHEIRLNQYSPQYAGGNRLQLGTSHSYGIERLHLIPEDGWDGLAVTATFHSPAGLAVRMLMGTDGMVDVPPEATASAGLGKIVISGVADGVQRISCNLPYTVMEHAHTFGGTSTGPAPDVISQILASTLEDRKAAAASAAQAEDAASSADASARAAAESEDASKSHAGNAASSASAAHASASTASAKAGEASVSAEQAEAEAAEAAKSASTATTRAAEVATSAQQAQANAAAAKASQDAAKASQDNAAKSANAAAGSATAAKSSETAAASSAKDAATSASSAATARDAAKASQTAAETAKTGAETAQKAAAASAGSASASASTATNQAAAAKASADAAARSATAAKASETAAGKSAQNAAAAESAAKAAQTAAETAKANADTAANAATAKATAASSSAAAAKSSENAAAKSADDAKNYAAQVAGIVTSQAVFGVNFSGSTSAGTRVGAAKDFVFVPGTDTSAGQNSFDAVYPWAGMRRCCCTLNADGTIKVNAYKGQPGYIEDGTNGEVLVEIPLFYVSGMLDVAPSISMSMLPGYRAPRKFINRDGSLKQKCYVRAFPGSIGADGKLHSIAGAVPTGNQNITRFLNAARQWGDTYSIGTSADFEVLAYLMVVVYGTRHAQSKISGCVSLYSTNLAVAAATDNAASVVVAKSAGIEPGMVISIGTGGEDETIAKRRIVTSVEAIDGDATNVKVNFDGNPVTTTTDHKVWRIMQGTGTANSVIATCGSPVSNADGRNSFVFYGVENPLYGNQWRFECDWKLIDGVPYWCDDPTKYSWTSNDGYIALDTMAMPDEGWATALQQDDRAPSVQITKSVGGSSGTYLADYFWINKSGVRVVRRGAYSSDGGRAGPFYVNLYFGAFWSGWDSGGDLSIPG